MLKIVKFDNTIRIFNELNIKSNMTIVTFSGYSYCISFNNLIQRIIISIKQNIEIISHYDLLPQLLLIQNVKKKMINIKLLNNIILTHNQQVVYINSLIFKKYIKINSLNTIKLKKKIFYIGCHIRIGDSCMNNNKTCKIDKRKVKNVVVNYNRICGINNCSLLISSDSVLFISYLKKYIPKIIVYREDYDIIHSNGINKNRNYSSQFYDKLLGDINLLTKSDFLILSSHSTFSLLILYNNKKKIYKRNNYIFYDGLKNIYDPLSIEIRKSEMRCYI